MVGGEGEDHFDGGSGFDWGSYKFDRFGVTVDMSVQRPVRAAGGAVERRHPRPVRFTQGRALRLGARRHPARRRRRCGRRSPRPAPRGASSPTSPSSTVCRAPRRRRDRARLGQHHPGRRRPRHHRGPRRHDLIDGDRWLNVRVSVRAGIDPVTGLPTGPGDRHPSTARSSPILIPFMLDGTYNPGQLQIVREILPGSRRLRHREFLRPPGELYDHCRR